MLARVPAGGGTNFYFNKNNINRSHRSSSKFICNNSFTRINKTSSTHSSNNYISPLLHVRTIENVFDQKSLSSNLRNRYSIPGLLISYYNEVVF